MMALMPGQHRYPARAIRPDPEEIKPAEARLGRVRLGEYLRACLRWLNADPDAALAAVERHWPPERPNGRPPQAPPEDSPAGPARRHTDHGDDPDPEPADHVATTGERTSS